MGGRPALLATFAQMPQDPCSGAARSVSTVCELLARSGWVVEALGTTATEGRLAQEPQAYLRSLGVCLAAIPGPEGSSCIRFSKRGVSYTLLDTRGKRAADTRQLSGDVFDKLFDRIVEEFRPSILLTYSGWLPEFDRRQRASRRGIRVVFNPHNPAYIRQLTFEGADAVFCATEYMARIAWQRFRWMPSVLPVPVVADDVVAPFRQPTFAAFINPEPAKGVVVFARILEQVSRRNPEIPFLIVNSRGSADILVALGRSGGLDLVNTNVLVSEPLGKPANLFAVTRVLIVPSLEEAAGRVAVEALLNGVPPLVSDRGGLPDVVGEHDFVIKIPARLSANTADLPTAEEVSHWTDRLIELMTNDAALGQAAVRAARAAERYTEDLLATTYDGFFRRVLMM